MFTAYLDPDGSVSNFSVGWLRRYVADFLDTLHGRKVSKTLGAEPEFEE